MFSSPDYGGVKQFLKIEFFESGTKSLFFPCIASLKSDPTVLSKSI